MHQFAGKFNLELPKHIFNIFSYYTSMLIIYME